MEFSDYLETRDAASALTGVEIVGVSQGGSAKRTTTQEIADLGGGTQDLEDVLNTGSDISSSQSIVLQPGGDLTISPSAAPALALSMGSNSLILSITNASLNFDQTNGVLFQDNRATTRGIEYGDDYTAGFQANTLITKAYADSLVTGLWDDRGNYNPTATSDYPASGGSGAGGAIMKGDIWTVSVAGTISGNVVNVGDTVRALVDTPGLTDANWAIAENNIGYIPENQANKATTFGTINDTLYPSVEAVQEYVVGSQDLFIPASAMWPRVTAGCSYLTRTEIATSLFNIQSLDFDQTTQEFAQFQISLPRNWNNGTITAKVYWTATSGSGTVQWGISGGAYSNDDALTVAFGTAQTVDDTLIATNDLHITDATSAITLEGTPADADFIALQVSRNPASDTLNADAKLLGVVITITTDAAKAA